MVISENGTRNYKIVYWGPGLCGKTTSIQYIYDNTPENLRTKLTSLATEVDRTIFFSHKENQNEFHLYALPGSVYYEESRRLLLKGADGIVFVADSLEERHPANIESLQMLDNHLKTYNLDLSEVPIVFCLNKRDLPSSIPENISDQEVNWYRYVLPVNVIVKSLKIEKYFYFETIASEGIGVIESFEKLKSLILNSKVS